MTSISDHHLNLYISLFCGRTDVYAEYWTSTSGKSGYKPIYSDANSNAEKLPTSIVQSHLEGKGLYGIYPLLSDNTCYFLAIDFDGDNWLLDASKVIELAKEYELTCYLERSKSGNGGHIWFFFEQAIAAWKARTAGNILLSKAKLSRTDSFDRMFPSQDEHTGKGIGNLIALPLHGTHLKQGNTGFINHKNIPYHDQWNFVESMRKNPTSIIDYVIHNEVFQASKNISATKEGTKDISVPISLSTTIVKITLTNIISIPAAFLPKKLYTVLRKKLILNNPDYSARQRQGYSTWRIPRWLYALQKTQDGITAPLGILIDIQRCCEEHHIEMHVTDQRTEHSISAMQNSITLRDSQKRVVRDLMKLDRVILEAKPGFGKTITALHCITQRRQKTLIIVHTNALLGQWKNSIEKYCVLKKGDLGVIGNSKWSIGNKITIASYKTLASRGMEELKNEFGFVVVDECHHVPARTFNNVVSQCSAKYALGLTATPYRRDKLDAFLPMYIGPIITVDTKENVENNNIQTQVQLRLTAFVLDNTRSMDFSAITQKLICNNTRNHLIAEDIASCLLKGYKCLVLSERVEHCSELLQIIRTKTKGIHGGLAEGRMTKKQREHLSGRIKQDRFQLLIATGKLIGEGFDWPEVTHLFLTFPLSWKGNLHQYVGRIQRVADGKEHAFVYDYVDLDIPILKRMYFKRLRTYRELGLIASRISSKQIQTESQPSLFDTL